jgi:hypothetical protein
MAQQVGMGGQSDAGGQAGEGAAGVVGVDRGAPLGAEHQVQLDRPGRPAGFDPSPRYRLRLPAGETPAGLLQAVLAQCLDRERWQGQDGAAGSGLDRPDREFLALAALSGSAMGWTAGSMMVRAWWNRVLDTLCCPYPHWRITSGTRQPDNQE